MGARSIPLTADERALLVLLDQAGTHGERVFERSGLDRPRFDVAAERLWRDMMLQGLPSEGCCQDPCGINCISASDPDQTWILTRFGKDMLDGASQ